jgi:hypothetical protein
VRALYRRTHSVSAGEVHGSTGAVAASNGAAQVRRERASQNGLGGALLGRGVWCVCVRACARACVLGGVYLAAKCQ